MSAAPWREAVHDAAKWLVENRDAISGPVIPALKSRFGLTNLEAIEATKLAHGIEYGEGLNGRRNQE